MKKILFALLLLPLLTFAQEGGELTIGERTVAYTNSTENELGTYYYADDSLVASVHEKVSLVYENDIAVLEAHDTNGDGTLDAFLSLDSEGEVTEMTGEGASIFERPETVEFADLMAADGGGSEVSDSDEDLVGDLDSITIPGNHNYTFYIFTVIFIGVAYWWYRRKKVGDDK